ncbi:rhomboid family intramembrane serine protease, partial [Escherichia coli]|nr:rhomboid family intramembrane serine protease [Escherichia coli]
AAGGALGWLRARLVGQNRLVTEGGIIVAVTLLLFGTIWLVQQQIDESVLQVRQSLREACYPQEIEKERRQKMQQLEEERHACP